VITMNPRDKASRSLVGFAPLTSALLVVALLGCGNYSNEDLAFVEALPEQGDLQASLPRQGTLTVNADDWYRTTKALIAIFNGAVEKSLALIGSIRHQYPTRRINHGRVWGPYPAEDKPGWSWMMVMRETNPAGGGSLFTYQLGFVPRGSANENALIAVLSGTFAPSATTRGGHGTINVDTAEARLNDIPLDNDNLASLKGSYANDAWPRTIELTWIPVTPNPPPAQDPKGPGDSSKSHYSFQLEQSGEGRVTYSYDDAGNPASLPGPAGLDQFGVVSRWQPTGIGRADAKVTSGDFAGATITHCWDDSLQTSYKAETSLGGVQAGDPGSCAYADLPTGF